MTRLRLTRPSSVEADPDYGEIFLAHAGRLRRIAVRLVDRHTDVEDLLQDACVQFVVARPELGAIGDPDSYLASLVRNLHLSRQRRRPNQRHLHVPISDYDTAELVLRASDGDRLIAREGLVRICSHLCVRKDTSRAASVLALRFIHGFFPAEISAIARVPYRAVRDWLRQGREEARHVLAQPDWTAPGGDAGTIALPSMASDDPAEIIGALREALFAARRSACPSPGALERQYDAESSPMDTSTLGHVVSCSTCLRRISRTLSLPDEDDRTGGDDGRQTTDGPPRPKPRKNALRSIASRVREVYEHEPRRLTVSLNGLVVGGVAVEGPRTDVQWSTRIDEPAVFVELLSEQGLLMAHLVMVPLPTGPVVQTLRLSLSGGRRLALSVDQTALHPVLSVQYEDPSFTAFENAGGRALEARPGQPAAPSRPRWLVDAVAAVEAQLAAWLRPALAVLGILVLGGLGMWRWGRAPVAPPAPAILLDAAAAREQSLAQDELRHRVLRFSTDGDGASYRIEHWEGARGSRAVRVVDRSGRLVAGEWTAPSTGTRRQLLGRFDDVWRAGLATGPFRQLTERLDCATSVEGEHYVVSCAPVRRATWLNQLVPSLHAQDNRTDIIRARLHLRMSDTHADRLDLTVREGGGERTLRLVEESYELVPANEAPAGTFVPPPPAGTAAATGTREPLAASPSLELRLVDTIDHLGAAGRVQVRRARDGHLQVSGYAATAAERRTLVAAIASVAGSASLTVDLPTAAEAEARRRRAAEAASAPSRAEARELPSGRAPFEAYLEEQLGQDGAAQAVVQALAPRVLEHARQSLFDARSLESLLQRFPSDTLRGLDAEGRQAWRAFVTRHADACAHALESLDAALADYFAVDPHEGTPLPASLDGLAHELAHEVTLVYENTAEAFTASEAATGPGLVRHDFRTHVRRALSVSRAVQAALTTTTP